MQQINEISSFLANSSFFYSIGIGMDSRYSYVSPNYDRNFDFLNESLLGKHFSITLHPDDIAICAEVGGKCFAEPDRLFPATLRKHDGKGGFVITQWEMKAFFDEDGQPVGIFCIGYNITEYMDTKSRLDDVQSELSVKDGRLQEIGFIQSHLVRKPLANIIGLTNILSTMEIDENLKSINKMLLDSSIELDTVVRTISNKSS
jgi:hypothetical protein